MRRRGWLVFALLPLTLIGCGGFGQVEQGRVIEYDREKGKVTMILDSNARPHGMPRYDVLPPITVRVPSDPSEMGPAPEAGRLLAVDSERRQIVTYDAAGGRLRTVSYVPIEERRSVRPNDPRLRMRLPLVNREKGTITLYEPRQRVLLTFSASSGQLGLPVETWKAGDEVRYYYKQPDRALRMMNVTKTDLSKAGE